MDNTTMMEVYPYGGVMAYLKYHYLDGVSKQQLLLMDKTRYDYDKGKKAAVASNPKSDKEAQRLARKYGIGQVREEIGD